MKKTPFLSCAFLVAALTLNAGQANLAHAKGKPGGGGSETPRWNVLMLGDSITEFGTATFNGGYPEQYVADLTGIYGTDTVYNFIGRGGSADVPREGYQGETTSFISAILTKGDSNGLHRHLTRNTPDVVLLHIATNDARLSIAPSTVEANIREIINKLKGFNPDVVVCLAQIIPWSSAFISPNANDYVVAYNPLIANIGLDTPNVVVVDQYTGFDSSHTTDGIHPNPSGAMKMSQEWIYQCPAVYQNEA